MPVNSRLASRLLPLASSTELVDMLLEASDEVLCSSQHRYRGVWSPERAAKLVKGPLSKAVAVVSHPRTHPEVLAKFAKDSRVSVRHALLANESTPYDTVLSLTPWALARADATALHSVFARLTARDILAHLSELPEGELLALSRAQGDPLASPKVARKCLKERETALAGAAISWPTLARMMVLKHQKSANPPVTLTELVEAMPESVRFQVVEAAMQRCTVVTVELAELARDHRDSYRGAATPGEDATLVEPGALSILARLGTDNLSFALANGLSEEDVLDLLKESTVFETATLVESMPQRRYSAKVEAALARRLIALGGDAAVAHERTGTAGLAGMLLRGASHPLSRDLLVSLLRHGSTLSTRIWLLESAGTPNAPQPGQLAELVDRPGEAFTVLERAMTRNYSWQVTARAMGSDELPSWMASMMRGGYYSSLPTLRLDPGVVDDIRSLLDPVLVGNLSYPPVAEVAMAHLEDVFGPDRRQWETFLTLAGDWTGGFADLVSATLALTGIPARERVTELAPSFEEPTLV